MKRFMLLVLAVFFVFGAGLWFWVAVTQSDPRLARAAFVIALAPAGAAVLILAERARLKSKPDHS